MMVALVNQRMNHGCTEESKEGGSEASQEGGCCAGGGGTEAPQASQEVSDV
jgi:hypothetical protein